MKGNQKSTTAAAAGLVVKASAGILTHLQGYNAKESAQFIQLHDAAAVPGNAVAGVAEISTIDFATLTGEDLADAHFLVSGASGRFYVWFNVAEAGEDPEIADATGVEVALAADDDATDIGDAVAAALDALADFGAVADAGEVTITDAATGAREDIAAGDSGASVAVTQQGVTAIAAAVPLAVITAAASSNFVLPVPAEGFECTNGISVCNSSAYATRVAGAADCFFTATFR